MRRIETNPEIIILEKEAQTVCDKYRVTRELTEEDYEVRVEKIPVGTPLTEDMYSINPPTDIKLAYDVFLNGAEHHFILHKINFLKSHNSWTIPAIEDELVKQEKYDKDKAAIYLFRSDYYRTNLIKSNDNELQKQYARHILYHDFLIDKIEELFHSCPFSSLQPDSQLDTLLRFFDNLKWSKNKRIQLGDVQMHLQLENINVSMPFLRAIVNKLVKDGYVEEIRLEKFDFPFYTIAFTGQFFLKKNGYTGETQKEDREKFYSQLRNVIVTTGAVLAGAYAIINIGKWLSAEKGYLPAIEFISLVCVAACAGLLVAIFIMLTKIRQKK